jgi:hypothetical protein
MGGADGVGGSTEVTKSVAATGVTTTAAINAAAQNRITDTMKKFLCTPVNF